MTPVTFLDDLVAAARDADTAEVTYRREASARIAALETERACAYRRLNWMKTVADAVAGAQDEAAALAQTRAALRARLGWAGEDEARDEVLARFDAVARAVFAGLTPKQLGEGADVAAVLAVFETWYRAGRGRPFWDLFEQPVVELPLVEC